MGFIEDLLRGKQGDSQRAQREWDDRKRIEKEEERRGEIIGLRRKEDRGLAIGFF